MVILALETVTRAGSMALFTQEGPNAAAPGDPTRTHGVRLPDELRQFAAAHGHRLEDVDAFAVVTGPGSFTGLRVGLATIQGLALAGHRPVIGIPTLEAMASGWLDEHAPPSPTRRRPSERDGLLIACLDAARGDVFYAAYDVTDAASIESARAIVEPRVGKPGVVAADIAGLRGTRRVTLIGDGAERYAAPLSAGIPDARVAVPMPNLAAAAARLAARRLTAATTPHALRPVYVRRPDAELARERGTAVRTDRDGPWSPGPLDPGGVSVFEVKAPGDMAAVAELQARAFGDAWGVEALRSELANSNVARLHAVRHRSGAVIAYCAGWLIVDELHINSLAVDPRYRRMGIARTLLRRVLAIAAAEGAVSATLEVRQSNEAGRALYQGLGFRVEGVRPGYYQHPREDGLILWRRGLEREPPPYTPAG